MRLARLELFGYGALAGVRLAFGEEEPRPMTVLFGGDGVGKTSILGAIGNTRPGHAIPIIPRRARNFGAPDEGERAVPFVVADWVLGDDDPGLLPTSGGPMRPHPLRVTSPNAQLGDADGEVALRRREQALFDRRAQEHGGYVFVSLSGARWFSRTPVVLASPERTILRYDPKTSPSFDDATRADLTRDVKQVLSFAGVGSALGAAPIVAFDHALRETAALALAPFRAEYAGVHATSLEPMFSFEGRDVGFEDLPRGARHLLATTTLAVRAVAAAYADERPIREREGVVVVDDLESQQDAPLLRHVPAMLRAALPRVQWIVATSSPAVTLGCERGEVVALRREVESDHVVVHEGAFAVLH